MKFPDDIREILKRRYKNKHGEWLKSLARSNCNVPVWPLIIHLDIPKEQDAFRQTEAVRSWIGAWRSWHGSGTLVWTECHWRSLGTQSVPQKLILHGPADTAGWIGEAERWARADDRYTSLVRRWPTLIDTLPGRFNVLADYDDSDFHRLVEVLSWICTNPNSNLYIRQLPVTGIDTKWLESRKGLVSELVAAIQGDPSGDLDFFRRCGIRPQPQLIRMRILDPVLKARFGGLGDITTPWEEAADLGISPAFVFIVENLQTGLAFGELTSSVVIMGLGYGVDVLGKIPWLRHARCIYWGDIDTHGFAILNRARTYLPNLKAVLMDESILLSHRELWVEEKDQHPSAELPLLTTLEQKLFHELKSNIWGNKIRLEQERIRWDEAWKVIQLEVAGVEPAS
ncbi:MAG: DUF2220 family protein [Treponema sp.]|nr:DUF2220 family protein [Treponema sp.]